MKDLRKPSARPRAVALAAGLVLSACSADNLPSIVPGDQANERLTITNTQSTLDARVVYTSQPVPVDSAPGAVPAKSSHITLTLRAEVFPPTVAGEVVQATSVSMDGGDKAMVSYNKQGAPRLGAIDFFDDLTKNNPKLRTQVTFTDSDVSAVATDGAYVYAAEATDAPGFAAPAVVERIGLKNNKFVLEDNLRIGLSSFAATSVMRTSDEVYVTTGDAGHVFALHKDDLRELGRFALSDARWVVWDKDGKRVVVVQGGQPNGQVSIFTEGSFPGGSMTLQNSYPFPGANIPESKSHADVAGELAFIAAGPEGVQIMCLDTGVIEGSVPRPDPASVGLDPSVVVTNAVTVDQDLMFISNGEAGVYVAQSDEDDFKDAECGEELEIEVIGRLRFDDLQSVNHVALENDYLFIAAGLGGVKVVRVEKN